MSIWNKVLVGLICVASLAFFYMAARTLKTHQYWSELAIKHNDKIKKVRDANAKLEVESRQRRVELSKLLLDRRRVWANCDPKVQGDAVTLTIEQPNPSGLAENTIVYAFERADVQKKGRYLGEFKVTKVDDKQKQVMVTPATLPGPSDVARLANVQRPWILYEVMPRDHVDQPDRVLADKSVRPMRDYQVLYSAASHKRTLLVDQIAVAECDRKLVEDALAQAKEQEAAVQKDIAAAKEEVKESSRQRDVVTDYHKTLEKELAAIKAAAAQLIETNKAMAGQLAKLQLEAARLIDQRTRAMAQSGTGG